MFFMKPPRCYLLSLLIFLLFVVDTGHSLNQQLFPYQLEGVEKLVARKRLLLADEMGLGKTVQAIEAINRIGKKDSIILVVCPKSVLGVWQSELQNWLQPTLASTWDIHVASTKSPPLPQPGSVTLINYDICHKFREAIRKPQYDVLICDEAHYLKSLAAKRTKAILGEQSSKKSSGAGIISEFLWLLTGTPILNRPVELFPLVNAIVPEEFPNFEDYADRYCNPQPRTIFARGRQITIQDYSGSSNLKELSERLDPIMLRRYKLDVLSELPSKFRQILSLTSDLDVAKQERELLALSGFDLNEFGSHANSLMNYIGADSDPLGKISTVRQEIAALKLKPSIELLEEYISQEKVVVFAHHRALIDKLMNHFGDRAVGLIGGMKRESRDEAVRRFQEDTNVRLFVGSLRAAGVGLTLTAASHVVFLELDWSPGAMVQAEDRCHRVGQANSVRVQYFVFKDTIDEWISKRLMFKQNTINTILPEKLGGTETGYVFNFGKHEGIRLEDAPRPYVHFLLEKEVWRKHPDLWRALAMMGLVSEEPPSESSEEKIRTTTINKILSEKLGEGTETGYVFNFGKHEGIRLEDAPRSYVQFLLEKEVWRKHLDLWRALATIGLVSEETPSESEQTIPTPTSQPSRSNIGASSNERNNKEDTAMITTAAEKLKKVDYVFDFGKHRGKRWEEVPADYRDWLLRFKVWKSVRRQKLLDALIDAGFQPP